MNLFNEVLLNVKSAAQTVNPNVSLLKVTVETSKDIAHGEMATNVAMVSAKEIGVSPKDFAISVSARLKEQNPHIESVEVAGPGFINMKFRPEFWRALVPQILNAGIKFGSSNLGQGQKFSVEYVSANPTGPLLASHARGAVFGDALCNLLNFVGYQVTREYYLNDYGNQVNILAQSVYLRYREALGETIQIPEGCYPGEYLMPVGAALAERDGSKWMKADESEWLPVFREFAINEMMKLITEDMKLLDVVQDNIISEKKLVEAGEVDAAFEYLKSKGDIYHGILEAPKGELPDDWEPREQWLFRATQYGDDVDRPLKKSDGSWTYFASDLACHYDKFRRGHKLMANVWGADHSGYVKRMVSGTQAVTDKQGELDVKIVQMVRLLEDGKIVKLSKRAGNLVFLSDVVERVGKDVVRLIMLTRRQDQTLDFDFTKATEQSKDNPVFYIQYAHARVCSVVRHAGENFTGENFDDAALAKADMNLLASDAEIAMIRKLAEWPRIVGVSAELHEPHRVAFYLQEVAAELHSLWTAGKDDTTLRFIVADDVKKTAARLALLRAAALVIAAGLAIIGVEPAEQM